MARDKFEVIEERLVGTLEATLMAEGDKLHRRQMRLETTGKKLAADTNKWEEAVLATIPAALKTSAQTGYKLTDKGNLYQLFCQCPEHQAELHGMGIIETVEAMIRSDAIPSSKVAQFRAAAYNTARAKNKNVFCN